MSLQLNQFPPTLLRTKLTMIKITLLLSITALVSGCASNNNTHVPATTQTVSLKDPTHIHLAKTHHLDSDDYIRITEVTGDRRGTLDPANAVLWMKRFRHTGIFQSETSWIRVSDIAAIQDGRSGRDVARNEVSILTAADKALGKKTMVYWQADFMVCEGTANPAVDQSPCMKADKFRGTVVYDRSDERPKDNVQVFRASDFSHDLRNDYQVNIVTAQQYSEKRAKAIKANDSYLARKEAERIAAERAAEQRAKAELEVLTKAKKGTQDFCDSGRVVYPVNVHVGTVDFYCRSVGVRSMSELNRYGWKTIHVERLPVASVTGVPGSTFNITIVRQ